MHVGFVVLCVIIVNLVSYFKGKLPTILCIKYSLLVMWSWTVLTCLLWVFNVASTTKQHFVLVKWEQSEYSVIIQQHIWNEVEPRGAIKPQTFLLTDCSRETGTARRVWGLIRVKPDRARACFSPLWEHSAAHYFPHGLQGDPETHFPFSAQSHTRSSD